MKSAAFTDERIGIMNEVICAMRVIKMYTWEDSFDELVSKVRMYVERDIAFIILATSDNVHIHQIYINTFAD